MRYKARSTSRGISCIAQEFIAIGSVEILRNGAEGERRIWPGGQFDPLGLSKGNLEELKTKVRTGRQFAVCPGHPGCACW